MLAGRAACPFEHAQGEPRKAVHIQSRHAGEIRPIRKSKFGIKRHLIRGEQDEGRTVGFGFQFRRDFFKTAPRFARPGPAQNHSERHAHHSVPKTLILLSHGGKPANNRQKSAHEPCTRVAGPFLSPPTPRAGTISHNRASLSLHGSPFSFYPACPLKKRITEATREISEEGFTVKNRDWNNRELLNEWREEWANYANRALEHAGIEERITHLSHEARGLEILPTVHLDHVAHEMEMRGIQTDRGNINRERQEYNRVVLDLHKYREEKKALEEKQQQERFSTPSERVQLQEASKYLKAEPSFKNVSERLQQLDKWEKSLDNNSQYLRWKDQTIEKAGEHFRWIHSFEEERIRQEQQRIENSNWLNPIKIKQNKAIKGQAEKQIAHLKARSSSMITS